MFKISNLASEVKFDNVGQSSFGSKVAYLTKGLCRKEIFLISIIFSKLWPFEIFNLASEVKFDLGGQSSFGSKVAYLTKELCRKEIVILSFQFDLGGQSSFRSKFFI